MLDRYTKGVLTVIALSLAVLATDSLSARLPIARAQSTAAQKHCVWTQVLESGPPSLGQNGDVKLGREWKAVSDAGGWELKATYNGLYVFERCESK